MLLMNAILLRQSVIEREQPLDFYEETLDNHDYFNDLVTVIALAEVSQQTYLETGQQDALNTLYEQINILEENRTDLLADEELRDRLALEPSSNSENIEDGDFESLDEFDDEPPEEFEEAEPEDMDYLESLVALDSALETYIQLLYKGIEQYDTDSLDDTIRLQLAQQVNEAQLGIQQSVIELMDIELGDPQEIESDIRIQINNALWIGWLMLGISGGILSILYGWLIHTLTKRDHREHSLRSTNHTLAQKLKIATSQLQTTQTSLKTELNLRQTLEATCQEIEQAKELTDLKLNFFSLASHELRTPLSAILVSAQLLDNPNAPWTEEKRSRNLRRIQSSAKTMTQLLADILLLTRAEAGKLEFNPQMIELQQFCQQLVEEVTFNTQAQHHITVVQHGQCEHAYLDEILLRAMLMSLLTNAIKYSPPESEIQFTIRGEIDHTAFQIQDQGIGIPPADQKHLFETFRRGANVKGITGTGLGLAVVKKCLDIHGGSIDVKSQVGIGTSFTIDIPWSTWEVNQLQPEI